MTIAVDDLEKEAHIKVAYSGDDMFEASIAETVMVRNGHSAKW